MQERNSILRGLPRRLNSPRPNGRVRCFITLDGGSHGKEEKRQESGKEKEKKESSKKESEEEVVEEACKKSGQEKIRPKEGETQRKGGEESRDASSYDGGVRGYNPFDSGDAGRGENRPEPRSRMALSDGFQAISGLGVYRGQSGGPCAPD